MIHILHLNKPASQWNDASPVGNGSLGGMLWGRPGAERVTLSEETIWAGLPITDADGDFRKKIDALRKKFLDGDLAGIDDAAETLLDGSFRRVRSAEYAGDLTIRTPLTGKATDYSRDLDLTDGVFETAYEMDGTGVRERAFCSHAHKVLALRFDFSEPCSLTVSYDRPNVTALKAHGDRLTAEARTACGNHAFSVGVKVETDGAVTADGKELAVRDARFAVLYIAVATEFNFGADHAAVLDDILTEAEDFDGMLAAHRADFSELSKQSDVTLLSPPEVEALPADERLDRLKNDPAAGDPGLAALYFAFGKYLLISSSREDTLPANLQGVWVEKLENPWNADYHTNINLQMNYWPAEVAGLGACHEALFRFMNEVLLPSGEKTAKELYGCRGTVSHHLSDLYGYTGPADGVWGLWPHGAGWLSTHMWEHYRFTQDLSFLEDTAYGFMKAAARFYLDYLFEGPDGRLHTGPSASPENRYYLPTPKGKQETYICFSPTMDIEIVGAVLRNFISAAELLETDEAMRREAADALGRLPALTVGPDGRLNEWLEPYEEPEPGHRHISHAFALYPDDAIGRDTPALFDAVSKTLEKRLANGGGHTGWSRAWLICLYARLGNGEEAAKHLRALFTKSTLPNLFDTHPPFQIDGNFGGAAGIAEMLLQSKENEIALLPAIPAGYTGSFTGLRARGGLSVDAAFENGRLASFAVASVTGGDVTVRLPAGTAVRGRRLKDGSLTVRLTGGKPAAFICET